MAGNTVLDGNSQYSRRCTEQSGGGSLAAFCICRGGSSVWLRCARMAIYF